jgi:hypothetical protein
MDVVKVDRYIAYVAMAIHVCCKMSVSNVSSVFQIYVANVFIWMLHVFYLDVAHAFAMAFQVFSGVFASVLDACFKCFIYLHTYCKCFIWFTGCFKNRSGVVVGDPPATVGVQAGKVEGPQVTLV